jgi:hypothetical protein
VLNGLSSSLAIRVGKFVDSLARGKSRHPRDRRATIRPEKSFADKLSGAYLPKTLRSGLPIRAARSRPLRGDSYERTHEADLGCDHHRDHRQLHRLASVVFVLYFDWVNQQVGNPVRSAMIIALSQILLVDVYYVLNGQRTMMVAGASAVVLLVGWVAGGMVYGKLLGGGSEAAA